MYSIYSFYCFGRYGKLSHAIVAHTTAENQAADEELRIRCLLEEQGFEFVPYNQ